MKHKSKWFLCHSDVYAANCCYCSSPQRQASVADVPKHCRTPGAHTAAARPEVHFIMSKHIHTYIYDCFFLFLHLLLLLLFTKRTFHY